MQTYSKTQTEELSYPCYTCGARIVNRGESANPLYLVIECPVYGEAFLMLKSRLGKLCSSETKVSH